MLKHNELWDAIDLLASKNGFSVSGLAKLSNLDSTIFNKSKRVNKDGKKRWPTTESIARILDTTGYSIGEFVSLIHNNTGTHSEIVHNVPSSSFLLSELQNHHHVNDFIVKIDTDAYEPYYPQGTRLIVSLCQNAISEEDKIILKLSNSLVKIGTLSDIGKEGYALRSLNDRTILAKFDENEITYIYKVLWRNEN